MNASSANSDSSTDAATAAPGPWVVHAREPTLAMWAIVAAAHVVLVALAWKRIPQLIADVHEHAKLKRITQKQAKTYSQLSQRVHTMFMFAYPVAFNCAFLYGFKFGVMASLAIHVAALLSETYVTNFTALNLAILGRNGISISRAFFYSFLSYCIGTAGTANMVLHDTYGADLSQTCLADVLAMLVSLTLGEIFFTLVHKFILHRTTFGAKIHACHHCARFSNVFVGTLFNPLDLFLEFTLPGVMASIVCVNLFQSKVALFITHIAVTSWYFLDHDAGLGLPHTTHHLQIARIYTIYIKYADGNAKDDTVLRSINWAGAEPEGEEGEVLAAIKKKQ